MITLSFVTGSAMRKVYLNGRKISMISQETGFQPISFDLDNINEEEVKEKMGEDAIKTLREIAKLEDEKSMMEDIKKDFQSTGWRLIKTERDG